jgi:glycosyltransferase involved in cell wall biosynthesis
VIAGNSSSLPEVIGDAGILVDSASSAELSGAMLKMLTDEKIRLNMSERSQKRSLVFSFDTVAKKIISAYETIANAPSL